MKSPKRITQNEYQLRLDMMTALLARCLPYSYMVKFACKQWNVSERQSKRYIQKARELEKRLGSETLMEGYHQILSKFNYIYQQALQLRDYELARRTAKDIAKLRKQEMKDLMNEDAQTYQSRLVDSDELEALIQSLESEEEPFED